MNAEHESPKKRRDMDLHLDRAQRVRSTVLYWLLLIGVGCLLAFLLMQFTGSKLIAFGLAGGMLLYMLIASAITSKHISESQGSGRMD
jgi:uncharacterized transporter YbjL